MAFVFAKRNLFRKAPTDAYFDNDNAICALIRGGRNADVTAEMVAFFRRSTRRFNIDISLGRVGAGLNIADCPTRTESSLPYEVSETTPYKELFKLTQIVISAPYHIFDKLAYAT